jgi:hypothetical protein
VAGEVSDAFDREVGGEHEGRDANAMDCAGLAFLVLAAQLPDDDCGGGELDH